MTYTTDIRTDIRTAIARLRALADATPGQILRPICVDVARMTLAEHDPASKAALDTALRYSRGEASQDELALARQGVRDVIRAVERRTARVHEQRGSQSSRKAALACCMPDARDAALACGRAVARFESRNRDRLWWD